MGGASLAQLWLLLLLTQHPVTSPFLWRKKTKMWAIANKLTAYNNQLQFRQYKRLVKVRYVALKVHMMQS
jgi:hypothetical protein